MNARRFTRRPVSGGSSCRGVVMMHLQLKDGALSAYWTEASNCPSGQSRQNAAHRSRFYAIFVRVSSYVCRRDHLASDMCLPPPRLHSLPVSGLAALVWAPGVRDLTGAAREPVGRA